MTKANLINGRLLATKILTNLANTVQQIKTSYNLTPKLAILLVGDSKASNLYINNKRNAAEKVGIDSVLINLRENIDQAEIIKQIEQLNQDKTVSGIIVQLPLPAHINLEKIFEHLDPMKDVDGFHPINVGYAYSGNKNGFIPCTALGCYKLIKTCFPNLAGKHVVIVGRSNIVGKPLASLLLNNNATVTICHSHTINLESITIWGDIVVTATGQPHFFTAKYFKETATVIDVGINWLGDNNKLVGDVKFDEVSEKVQYISPVPGGVGPMTVAYLLKNTVRALKKQHNL